MNRFTVSLFFILTALAIQLVNAAITADCTRNFFSIIIFGGCSSETPRNQAISQAHADAVVEVLVYRKPIQEAARERLIREAPQYLQHLLRSANATDGEWVLVQKGSGFFISEGGEILTSLHALSQAQKIEVRLPSGESYIGTILFASPELDYAVLTLLTRTPKIFPYFPLAPCDNQIRTGDAVRCSRATPDESTRLVHGEVTASELDLSDTFESVKTPYLQTNCPISKGFSGGPVLNQQGLVIGMSSHIVVDSAQKDLSEAALAIPIRKIQESREFRDAISNQVFKAHVPPGHLSCI